MLKAVIFDLDGVLLDPEPLYTEAYQRVTQLFGKNYNWEIKAGSIGRKSIDSARRVVEQLELPISPEEFLSRRNVHLNELFENVPAMPGAEKLVRALAQKNIPFALATSSSRPQMKQKIAPHPWFDLFQAFWAGDDEAVHEGKPAPDIFLCAAESLNIVPENCLVFEDSPSGVEAASRAGMRCIAIPDPMMKPELYLKNTQFINAFSDIDLEQLFPSS